MASKHPRLRTFFTFVLFTTLISSISTLGLFLITTPSYAQSANAWNLHRRNAGNDLDFYYGLSGQTGLRLLQGGGEIQARKFTDLDNTGNYIDPSSTSVINALTMTGALTVNGSQTLTGNSTINGSQSLTGNLTISNGNIGIRTTTPTANLTINQSTNSQGTGGLRSYNTGGTSSLALFQGGDNNTYLGNFGAGGMLLYVNSFATQAMSMTSAGNVGVGPFTPARKFSVNDGNGDHLNMYQYTDDAMAIQTSLNGQPIGAHGDHPAERLLLQPSAGIVAIGHNNPQGRLDIRAWGDDTTPIIRLRQSNASTYGYDLGIDNNLDGGLYFYRNNNGAQSITMSMRRDNGNIGIGRTDPGARLHIKQASNGWDGGIRLERVDTGTYQGIVTGADDALAIGGPTGYCTIGAGRGWNCPVGVSAFSRVDATQLRVLQATAGPGVCYDGSLFVGPCSSDARLKQNIRYFDDISGLDIIEQLKPALYDVIKDGTKNQPGFIAQDVQKVLPNTVTTGEDGYLLFGRDLLIPYLTKAIQELNTQNKQQQAQIDDLNNRINKLEKKQTEIEDLKKEIENLKANSAN